MYKIVKSGLVKPLPASCVRSKDKSMEQLFVHNPIENTRSIIILHVFCDGKILQNLQLVDCRGEVNGEGALIDFEVSNIYVRCDLGLPSGDSVVFFEVFPFHLSPDRFGFGSILVKTRERKRFRTEPAKPRQCTCEFDGSMEVESSEIVCHCCTNFEPFFLTINPVNGILMGMFARITKKINWNPYLVVYELNETENSVKEHSTNFIPMNKLPFDSYFVKNGSQLLVSFNCDFIRHLPMSLQRESDGRPGFVLFDFSNGMFSPAIVNIYIPEIMNWGSCIKPKCWPMCSTIATNVDDISKCIGSSNSIGRLYKYSFFFTLGRYEESLSEIVKAQRNYQIVAIKNLAKSVINQEVSEIILSNFSDLLPSLQYKLSELAKKEHKGLRFKSSCRCEFWGNDYFAIRFMKRTHQKYEDTVTTVQLSFRNRFKDYRRCANCKRSESHKRQNIDGKRIANFKVCAVCKRKNIHLRWKLFPCHFCSIKCLKSCWNKHKKQH